MSKINFTEEQDDFLKRKFREGDVLLRGGAGTGKTVCAVEYTQRFFNREQLDLFNPGVHRVGILTYTRALVGELKRVLGWTEEDWREGRAEANTIDSFVYHQIEESLLARGVNTRVRENVLLNYALKAKNAVFPEGDGSALAKKDAEFFLEEIRWIKGNELQTLEDYYKIKRIGRGGDIRITRENREKLWAIYTEYQRMMQEADYWDFLDRQAFLLHLLEEGEVTPMFRHLTIDEVQDCSRLTIRLLKKLVIPGGTCLWVGDMAQKIYRNSFAWKDVGVNVHGRTTILKQNHRNTLQIHRLGQAILQREENEEVKKEFTAVEAPQHEGPLPICYQLGPVANSEKLVELLKNLPKDSSCVIATPTNQQLDLLMELLKKREIPFHDLRDKNKRAETGCFVSTFHSIKGLSLDYVFLLGLDSISFPLATSDEERIRDRGLLHMAVTRAQKEVYLFSNGNLTSYLEFIPSEVMKREEGEVITF